MLATVDLRPLLGPVRNQGPLRGTCLAFAITATHDHAASVAPDSLSVETLYWAAKQYDGIAAAGTTFEAASTGLATNGQPHEHVWAYDPLRDDLSPAYQPPPEAVDPANCYRAKLTELDAEGATIRAALGAGFPVAIGIPTWPGLRRPNGSYLRNPTTAELDGCHHAVVIVGYQPATAEILLRNSWGTSWGDGGHAWIAESFIADHVVCAWQIAPST